MREEVGLLMVEKDGGVKVQLFGHPSEAAKVFVDLAGNTGDAPWRATFISMKWVAGKLECVAESKELPKKPSTEWGRRLGQGPIDPPPEDVKVE
jgi:hypothetical protein